MCSKFDKAFKYINHLRNHERTYTEEKQFACSMFDMSFNHTLILKAHERMHTREKPFACSQCRVHLQVHERTHIGKKPNTCFKCHKTFKVICHLKECEKAFEQKANINHVFAQKSAARGRI